MTPFRILKSTPKLNFVGLRKLGLVFSVVLLAVTAVSMVTQSLNFGIDFKGGILVEVRTEGPADIAAMRSTLEQLPIGEVSLQEFGAVTDVLIRIQAPEDGGEGEARIVGLVRDTLGTEVEYRRVEYVGPSVGEELISDGIMAVGLALFAIMAYVWFRFEWQFGASGVITLLHDVLLMIGFMSVLQLEFNLSTVAAILTIAGYSINDTVVVFDRVRENLRKYKKLAIPDLCNLSINETLSRTLLTSGTTLLALLSLFIFGGPVIREFSGALIFGILIGTYSSIFVATPILLQLNLQRGSDEEEDSGKPKPDAVV
ncbi:MAG: protein translocase subunit SecF [Alphaproteobacteria bacterium]|nr:protein translocase subunit SecF [Alphaproteobacteria bacterium]